MINLIKIGDAYNVPIKEYEVDEASELGQINNAPVGSVATVNSTGDTYKLRSTGSWTKSSSGGGPSPSGGSDLPDVTAVDNGKVLTVVNGSWDKADPQGGSGEDNDFIISATLNLTSTPPSMSGLNKTNAQILAAIQADKNVRLVAKTSSPFNAEIDLDLVTLSDASGTSEFWFSGVCEFNGIDYVIKVMTTGSDGSTTVTMYPVEEQYVVTLTHPDSNYVISHKGTRIYITDILTAWNNGKQVIIHTSVTGLPHEFLLASVQSSPYMAVFANTTYNGQTNSHLTYIVIGTSNNETETWNVQQVPVRELPVVDSNNNGQILKVSSGSWTAGDPDVAYPIIHGTVDTRVTPLAMTITETDEQILAAVATGKPILLQYTVITGEGTSIPSYHFCNAAVTLLSNVACAINAFINTGIDNGAVQYIKTEIYIGVNSEPGVTRQIILTPVELNSLPSFDSLDSGKVLSINNSGALTWITNNSNVPYIVHMELNLGAGTATITDGKTINDILAVAASNPNIYAEFALGTGHGRLPLVGWDSNTALGESTVTFSGVSVGAKGILIEGENDGTADTWTITPES